MLHEENPEISPRKGETREKDEYPFEIRNVEESINKEMLQHFTSEYTGYLQFGEKKWCFPSNTRYLLKDFYNMEVRPTDVWIVTFPRSGTTLTQEMVWQLINNLNYEEASKTALEQRAPFLEFHTLIHPKQIEVFLEENAQSEDNRRAIKEMTAGMFEHLTRTTRRRVIKTHLPLSLLPKNLLTAGCKVVYVARNPKDVAISYYHHNRLFRTRGYNGDFPTYWKFFSRNLVVYAPYWAHVLEGWNKRHEENFIFFFYENLIKDKKDTIYKLQKFFGTNYSEEEINTLEKHLEFDNFQKNKSVNYNIMVELGIFKKGEENFVRKGNTGNANSYFNKEELAEADKWVEENLKGTDLRFPDM